VQIRTRVDETDIGKVTAGMPTKVTVAAYPNQPFDGVVLKIEPQAVVEQNVTMFSVLIKIANREGLLKPGMNADVKIRIATRDSVAAVPTAALRADTDVSLSARMLGVEEAQLRQQIWPDSKAGEQAGSGGKNVITLNGGREIPLPDGVDAAAVKALMEKRRSGQELSDAERALLRNVFQGAGFGGGGAPGGGFAGGAPGGQGGGAGGVASGARPGGSGAGPGGGGFGGGGVPPGGFAQGGPGGNAGSAPARPSYYQFGGDYWVIALRNDQPVPVAVKTGLTDLEYSEVVSGLQPGDRVLLLPSTSLFEQQERLQQFISSRFSSTPFQQNQGQQFRGRPF
jgi:HlyD family secretion protein